MGLIGCPETSVGKYHYMLRNKPEKRRFFLPYIQVTNSPHKHSRIAGFENSYSSIHKVQGSIPIVVANIKITK
jgi:hypothetical protein